VMGRTLCGRLRTHSGRLRVLTAQLAVARLNADPRTCGNLPREVAGKRVLVVDDDPDIRELLFTALEDEGFEVVPAGNGREPLTVMVAALLPTALLSWYLSDPARNQPIVIRLEHFVITSNVSVVAAVVAFLVARAALGVGHYRALLIALGFACMAAIFAVHGL